MNFINLSPFRPAVYTAQIMIENYPTPFRTRNLEQEVSNSDNDMPIFSSPYPNPANEYILIDCNNTTNESDYLCRVYNITGQLINNYSINNNKFFIDTRSYTYGVYIVAILKNNTLINSSKFIIK